MISTVYYINLTKNRNRYSIQNTFYGKRKHDVMILQSWFDMDLRPPSSERAVNILK